MAVPDPLTTGITTGIVLGLANQAAKQAQDFIAAAVGHKGESIGSILGTIMERRRKNAESVASKAHLTVLKIGFAPQEIPLKILHPALEAASLEDDDELQNLWANLLANASDPRAPEAVEGLYISILRELSTRDVKMLNGIHAIAEQRSAAVWAVEKITGVEFRKNDLIRLFGELGFSRFPNPLHITQGEADANRALVDADDRNFGYTMDVLTRNRLVEENLKSKGRQTKDFATGVVTEADFSVESIFGLTDLGACFVKACHPPPKP